MKDRERREKTRKQRQEMAEREQRKKIEHAIERAKKPIPKKTGRPLYGRCLPVTVVRRDDEEIMRRRQLELLNEQRFLFGNPEDECM